MNNHGLEALAALASSVSACNTSNNPDVQNQVDRSAGTATTATTQNHIASAQSSDFARVMQNAASLLHSTQNVAPQNWQQILTAAANSLNMSTNPSITMVQPSPPVNQADPSALATLQQQISLYQRLMFNQPQQLSTGIQMLNQASAPVMSAISSNNQSETQTMQHPFSAQQGTPSPFGHRVENKALVPVVPQVPSNKDSAKTKSNVDINIAKEPTVPTVNADGAQRPVQAKVNNASSSSAAVHLQPIAPQPMHAKIDKDVSDDRSLVYGQGGDKKTQKRAANRRSAQLSRKRKKQFIEELKDENDDLRRKEQILKSIPDLVVVFDSSGKLWFVSESVCRFLSFNADELEGTSFWNRLCDDSVRLLKAAFMDSLAARNNESDTAPLGSGFWELRLVDRDGSQKIVTLNGVVHFAGDRPECVCSIRPSEEKSTDEESNAKKEIQGTTSSSSVFTNHKSLIRVQPQQSVVSNGSSLSVTSSRRRAGKDQDAVRISDSGNSSCSGSNSDAGCSDDIDATVQY